MSRRNSDVKMTVSMGEDGQWKIKKISEPHQPLTPAQTPKTSRASSFRSLAGALSPRDPHGQFTSRTLPISPRFTRAASSVSSARVHQGAKEQRFVRSRPHSPVHTPRQSQPQPPSQPHSPSQHQAQSQSQPQSLSQPQSPSHQPKIHRAKSINFAESNHDDLIRDLRMQMEVLKEKLERKKAEAEEWKRRALKAENAHKSHADDSSSVDLTLPVQLKFKDLIIQDMKSQITQAHQRVRFT